MIKRIKEDKGYYRDLFPSVFLIAILLGVAMFYKSPAEVNNEIAEEIVKQIEDELDNVEEGIIKNGKFNKEGEFELKRAIKEVSSNVYIDEIVEEDNKIHISIYYSGKNRRGNEIVRKDIFRTIELKE